MQGPVGSTAEQRDRGEQGERSNVLSVLADHLPIQLVTRYGEKMSSIMYQRTGPVS